VGFDAENRVRPAQKALDAKSATNFEKARMLWKLLSRAGVNAEYAYAARYLDGHYDKKAPIDGLEHQVIWIPPQLDISDGLFVDPSCEFCRVGEVPEWDQGVEALILHATRSALQKDAKVEVEFKTMSGKTPLARQAQATFQLRMEESGDANVALNVAYQGEEAQRLRVHLAKSSAESQKARAESWARPAGALFELKSFEPPRSSDSGGSATERVEYVVRALGVVDGAQMIVPLSVVTADPDRWFAADRRKTDIEFRSNQAREDVAVIDAPPGWVLDRLPEAAKIETQAISVEISAKNENGRAVLRRSVRAKRGHYSKDQYADMKRALDAFRALRKETVTFKKP
jgi:hypothetical protein